MIARAFLAALALATAAPAAALELLAPSPAGTLGQSRVVVIGRAPAAERGVAEWGGGSTSFRVRGGHFSVTLNLEPGRRKVTFRVGAETLEADWVVGGEGGGEGYSYHPKVGEGECAACHDPAAPPAGGDNVAALCQGCHSPYSQRRFVHGPVGMGLCSACHDPHGSANPALLRFPDAELCTYCHNQPVTEEHRKESGGRACTACHDPHGTNRPFHVKSR